MHSSTFPWLESLTDEEAYAFLDELIKAAQTTGTHTGFLHALDESVAAWAAATDAVCKDLVRE
ncbi:hypothetical protein OG786_20850 [Streptomyces sp. NBC_00101]|uniref:hypothetical protein n=1 Tax=Streptomyces sp. NBC_00101 TaxID=2975651 RepID=UPI003245BD94